MLTRMSNWIQTACPLANVWTVTRPFSFSFPLSFFFLSETQAWVCGGIIGHTDSLQMLFSLNQQSNFRCCISVTFGDPERCVPHGVFFFREWPWRCCRSQFCNGSKYINATVKKKIKKHVDEFFKLLCECLIIFIHPRSENKEGAVGQNMIIYGGGFKFSSKDLRFFIVSERPTLIWRFVTVDSSEHADTHEPQLLLLLLLLWGEENQEVSLLGTENKSFKKRPRIWTNLSCWMFYQFAQSVDFFLSLYSDVAAS